MSRFSWFLLAILFVVVVVLLLLLLLFLLVPEPPKTRFRRVTTVYEFYVSREVCSVALKPIRFGLSWTRACIQEDQKKKA